MIYSLLEKRQFAYVGSDAATLSLVLSKVALKDRWSTVGIPTPRYSVIRKTQNGLIQGLNEVLEYRDYP